MRFAQPPVVRLEVDHAVEADLLPEGQWPRTIPAVAQLLAEGLDLTPGVTFLVGENGSGKSTLVEAAAAAFGLGPEGGSTQGGHSTRHTESPLGQALLARRGIGAPRWGFFLRAETMHGWYTYSESLADDFSSPPPTFHEMSHGESFLSVVANRLNAPGFYCLDEPEAALSFMSTFALMSALTDLRDQGAQVLCATHSPMLAALPGARILEVGDWGLRESAWEDLELVQHWRAFLDTPDRYLRHLD